MIDDLFKSLFLPSFCSYNQLKAQSEGIASFLFSLFGCSSDKTSNLKTLPWALGNGEGHFDYFLLFIDKKRKKNHRLIKERTD